MHIYNRHVVCCLVRHFYAMSDTIINSFLYEPIERNKVKVLARKHYACTTFTRIFMASVLSVSETLCYVNVNVN